MGGIHFRSGDNFDTAARIDALQAKAEARDASREMHLMHAEINRLYMITEALWMVLRDFGDYDDKTLTDMVADIDMRDGRLDGQSNVKHKPDHCTKCNRVQLRHHPLCIYCGARFKQGTFE